MHQTGINGMFTAMTQFRSGNGIDSGDDNLLIQEAENDDD